MSCSKLNAASLFEVLCVNENTVEASSALLPVLYHKDPQEGVERWSRKALPEPAGDKGPESRGAINPADEQTERQQPV